MATPKRDRVQELESHVLKLGRMIGRMPTKIRVMLAEQTGEIKGHFNAKHSILQSQQMVLERRVRAIEEREQVRDGLGHPGNGAPS